MRSKMKKYGKERRGDAKLRLPRKRKKKMVGKEKRRNGHN